MATERAHPEKRDREQALGDQLCPELFRALSDPTRKMVLVRLATSAGPLPVSDVADCCGVHLSGVSRHLSILRKAGIVQAERQGREVRYTLDAGSLVRTLRGLADAIEACGEACCAPAEGAGTGEEDGEGNRTERSEDDGQGRGT